MPKKSTITQAKYDAMNCKNYHIKLVYKTDNDIIEKLSSVPSMQGYIKQLIREDIARTQSAPVSVPSTPFATPAVDDETKEQILNQLRNDPDVIKLSKAIEQIGIDRIKQLLPTMKQPVPKTDK